MKARAFLGWLRDTVFRLFPNAVRTGLRRIGEPGPDSPVLVTGNFRLTVRRMEEALDGQDAWLLVTNSNGINVWCAAGGGHLTHHDVIASIRASRLGEHVRHRELILPQLSATGIERGKITRATGWTAKWGPARLEDIPDFLERGGRVRQAHRLMRFPLWERLELALVWTVPMAIGAAVILGFVQGWLQALIAGGVIVLMVLGVFVGLPWLPVTGGRRWLTFVGFAAGGFVLGAGALSLLSASGESQLVALGLVFGLAMLLLSVELAGTTPWYPSTINFFRNQHSVELIPDRCTGAAECVLVCPRNVLRMDGGQRRVVVLRPEACIRCGACIVQCPEDALRFRFDDGRIVEPATVRRTRLNLLGRRTVSVGLPAERANPD